MQGEKKFEITLSHKLTGFFTQDGDYIEALKVVGKSASDATQLEAAKNYLIDNDLFAKHPNLLGLNDICSNFLGYEFDESDPKRIAEAFRKPEFVKALQADKTLLEIFNSEDSQVEAAKLFVMTAPGLNIVFFVALSGNPQFVEDFISRVESSGALKGKFDINTHYTEHKLNLLFCATLLRSPQLLANFLDKKIDLNHKIKNHDQYYTLLQMMLFFYNNAEMLKTLKEKLHAETYSALINNITLEPMNSGITQTDLLSFALESDLLKGKDKALIELVDFCSRDIKVSDTLLGLINTKLSGETKTAVTEKLKPAKAAEEEHQQQNASTGNGSGLLDDEPVDEVHQEQPLQNASVGNGSGILTDEPVDEAHQEQPLQNASARDPSDLLADEPEDVVHQEQPLQNASGRETSGLLTDEPEDVAHQEQRSQNASAREPSGLLTEEPVDPEHQEQRSQNASAREPSGLLTEEPVDPEHQEQRSQNASAREPSGLLTEEPVDPEHQEQRSQ
ncbi:MAG: hypothetical protein K2X50_08260, partial [Gammaproteobacteria bacterium]|nr:hypothetical protein [Gammaproteobacteria bacterium]